MSALRGFSPLVRRRIDERSDGICEIQAVCSGALAVQKHHRRCRGMGSTRRPETNQAANGLNSCQSCHEHVESHRAKALSCGWLVSQHRTPSEVPVLRRGQWVMFDDRGDIQLIPEPAGGRVA